MTTALLTLVSTNAAMATWGDPWEAAAHRELNRAITPQANNEHLMRLSALRALHDQRLEPLLVSLTTDDDPSIQIHALLGLAELSVDGRIDPARVVAASPTARQATISLGLDSDRLLPDDINYVLERGELTADTRLQLLTSLIEQGEHVDASTVAAIDTSLNPNAHARKVALLSNLGDAHGLLALSARSTKQPDDLAIQDACFEAIIQLRRLPSEAGISFAHACIDAELPAGLRRFAMLMLLEQGAPDVADLFSDEFTRATRRRHQLDLALLLLMTQTPAPARSIAAFGNDELLGPIGQASLYLSSDPARALPHLETLIDTRHRRTTSWILDSASAWPDTMAVPLLERILDQTIAAGLQSTLSAHGVDAASALLKRAPEQFRNRLANAIDDGPEQQLLLLAILQQPAPELLDVVTSIRRIGVGQADILTLLVIARDSDSIKATDVANLKLVAASTGASHAIRTQAAWLAVRHTGVVDDMVAALLKPTH
jgi:hypothetical protein